MFRYFTFLWIIYNVVVISTDIIPPVRPSWIIQAFITPLATAYVIFYPEIFEWLEPVKKAFWAKWITIFGVGIVRSIFTHATGIDTHPI